MQKVVLIGGAGYIGSVIQEEMRGVYDFIVYDNFLYGKNREFDIRNLKLLYPILEQADIVVNLAGLSNDPLSEIDPNATWEINYKANEPIAKLLRNSGKRVIYVSSCSVYGFGNGFFNEESKPNPQTLYAKTKMLSEELYLHQDLNSVALRLATVYGISPMPRFDLVVNKMIADAYFKKLIEVNGGNQWRPIVHVRDVARAIMFTIEHGDGVYNVGSDAQNYMIKDLGKLIKANTPEAEIKTYEDSIDTRSYKVDFDKIHQLGYKTMCTVETAITELYNAFIEKKIKNINKDFYYRVKHLRRNKRGLRSR